MKYEEVMEQKKGFKVERVNIKEGTMTITVSDDWIETVSDAVEKQIPQKARYLQQRKNKHKTSCCGKQMTYKVGYGYVCEKCGKTKEVI